MKTLYSCRNQRFLLFGSLSIYFQKNKVGMTLLSRAHLYFKAEYDSDHFQFLTRHYHQKLGLSTEVKFLSEPKHGLISSSKSKFRDQDQIFWLDRTMGKSNPNLLLKQKTSSVEIQLEIQFRHLNLVRSKSFAFYACVQQL